MMSLTFTFLKSLSIYIVHAAFHYRAFLYFAKFSHRNHQIIHREAKSLHLFAFSHGKL